MSEPRNLGEAGPETPIGMDDYSIDDYWMALYRRKGIILLVVATALSFSILIGRLMTPIYEAKAVFYVPEDVSSSADISGKEISKARTPSGDMDKAKGYMGILKGNDARRVVHERYPQKSLEELDRDVDFSVTREGLIRVFVRDPDPALAARVANEYVSYFNDFVREVTQSDLEASLLKIQQEAGDAGKALDRAVLAKQRFQERHNISSLRTELEELERQRTKFQENLDSALVEEQSLDQQIGGIEQQLAIESENYTRGDVLLHTKVVDSLQETVAQLEVDLAGKQAELKPDHPEVRSLQTRLDVARQNLKNEIQRIIGSKSKLPDSLHETLRRKVTLLHVDRKSNEAKIKGLRQILRSIDRKIGTLPAIVTESERAEEAVRQIREVKQTLESSRDNLKVGSLQYKRTGVVIDTARPPISPVFPIWWLNGGIALIVGLMTGVLYALFLEHLEVRARVRRLADLELAEWLRSRERNP